MSDIQVTYTEGLDGVTGQQTPYIFQIGPSFGPLQLPPHVAAHRRIQNFGPERVLIGPHPKPDRAFLLEPGMSVTFQRQGTLFAGTVT